MIGAGNDQFGFGMLRRNFDKSVDDWLQALVGSPFPERQYAVKRIAALRKVRILGPAGQNSMTPHMHGTTAVFFANQAAIGGQQHRDGIGKQKELSRDKTRSAVCRFEADTGILQVDRLHQLMKRHMCVKTIESRNGGNRDADERGQRFTAETGKSEIEPNYVGFTPADFANQTPGIGESVECPAAHHIVPVQLRLGRIEVIAQDCELEAFGVLQLPGDVKPILVQGLPARRECGD